MNRDFVFGTATASYQIEGAAAEDGRTPSIWDTFCAVPGNVMAGDSGAVACDHYHRYKEDVALMRELGVDSYRFSIAWPRIFPAPGQYNPAGMAFYKNLVAELARAGIAPSITLYHWDLPQWAQDQGGWENRECVNWFLEYAARCFAELDAANVMWITHNEPWCAAFLGNFTGEHAPGYNDAERALRVAHHLLLSHGAAVQHYRAGGGKGRIGITLNLSPVYVASGSFADNLAGAMQGGYQNRWFMDPLFRKSYPADIAAAFALHTGTDFDFVLPGDFEVIAAQCDFLGLNFYSRSFVKYQPTGFLLAKPAHSPLPQTDMGWDICPETLGDLVREIRSYTALPLYITENGSAWPDVVAADGAVHDEDRVEYLLQHLAAVEQLNREGMDIAGYYCWSLLDNFEWAWGYGKRFGIVRVDYDTQKRTPKDSYYAYQQYIRQARGGY